MLSVAATPRVRKAITDMRRWATDSEIEYLATLAWTHRQARLSLARAGASLCPREEEDESQKADYTLLQEARDDIGNSCGVQLLYIESFGAEKSDMPRHASRKADLQRRIDETIECFESVLKDWSVGAHNILSSEGKVPNTESADSADAFRGFMNTSLDTGHSPQKRRMSEDAEEGGYASKRPCTLDAPLATAHPPPGHE